jgi:hypothetical protein
MFPGGWRRPVRRADKLSTFMCRLSWNLETSTFWNPQGLSRPVMGLLYLCLTLLWGRKCGLERKFCTGEFVTDSEEWTVLVTFTCSCAYTCSEVRLRAGIPPSPSPNKSDIEILVGFILPDVMVESVTNLFLGLTAPSFGYSRGRWMVNWKGSVRKRSGKLSDVRDTRRDPWILALCSPVFEPRTIRIRRSVWYPVSSLSWILILNIFGC